MRLLKMSLILRNIVQRKNCTKWVIVFPGRRPFAWPPALALPPAPAPSPGPQFVVTGTGPQFVFTGRGPQFVFTGPGPKFLFTDPDPQFLFGRGP